MQSPQRWTQPLHRLNHLPEWWTGWKTYSNLMQYCIAPYATAPYATAPHCTVYCSTVTWVERHSLWIHLVSPPHYQCEEVPFTKCAISPSGHVVLSQFLCRLILSPLISSNRSLLHCLPWSFIQYRIIAYHYFNTIFIISIFIFIRRSLLESPYDNLFYSDGIVLPALFVFFISFRFE